MSHAFAGRSVSKADGSLEKGRVDVTKVKRYWRGRVPEWAEEEAEVAEKEPKRETAAPVIISKTSDPRLERLSLSDVKRETATPAHRRVQPASTSAAVGSAAPEVAKGESAASVLERRAQLRLKLLEARKDEPALLSEEEEEETSSDDSESVDEDVELSHRPLMKPVFVSAEMRETVQERERLEEEEEREWEAQKLKLQQRREDTREIVAQKIRDEEEAELNKKSDIPIEAADINTDDDADEENTEFDLWKQREKSRVKRDKEEVLISEKYAEEREKLKNMTEEERIEYEKANPKVEVQKVKKKWKFLQKYWHKGAFYQEDPDDVRGTAGTDNGIFGRDYSDPTGEDKMDKAMLPKIMQVKNFGRSGRTKWTHLVAEDTTNFDDPWTNDNSLRMKYNRRMAASEQEFQKPKKFKS